MTLKALLMGSAAAMIAVSGAKAADAVVAEPEAVEYVKVCDTYGAGFYFIPGTETCLKIKGYVRVNYTYDTENVPAAAAGGPRSDSHNLNFRGYVEFDAREETDYGTLRSEIRIQGDGDASGAGNVYIDRGLISLGGLRVGFSDNFWSTNGGYGLPTAINSGYYGFGQSIFLDYTYAANGFSFTAGVEDIRGNANGTNLNVQDPNFYAGGSYSGSWGSVAATVAYDGVLGEAAYKGVASFNVFEGFTLKGFYAADGAGVNTSYVSGTGDFAWGVGVNYAATDALDLYAGYGDNDGANQEYWNVGANYDITTNFRVQGEVNIYDGYEDFRLRIQRSF